METDPAEAQEYALRCKFRDGDNDAWTTYVRRHDALLRLRARRLLPYGDRLDAEIAVGEMWMRAVRARREFDPSLDPLPWLSTILAHYCTNLRRELSHGEVSLPGEDAGPAAYDPEPAQFAREEIASMLPRVEPEDREIVTLRYLLDLPVNIIAPMLGLTEHAVRERLRKALERLRGVGGAD